ncbi:MAG: hypothetical protein AAF851_03425 [Myxococcota bacterium]
MGELGFARAQALSGDEALRAALDAAAVLREDARDLEGAAEAYRFAHERGPDVREAFLGLANVLHELHDLNGLRRLYQTQLKRSSERGEQATLWAYLAEVEGDGADDPSAAVDALVKASRLQPGLRILPRLEHWATAAGRLRDLELVMAELLVWQDDPEVRAALSHRLAQLHLGPLDDRERAMAHLQSALYELGEPTEGIRSIEDTAIHRSRFQALEDELAQLCRDRRSGPHRIRLERELGALYFDRGEQERGLRALTRALELAPEDRELQNEVLRVGLVAQDLGRVAEVFERVADQTQHRLLRTFLRLRLGQIYGQSLGRPNDAVRVYEDILEDEPTHVEARRRLEPLLERLEDREGQVKLLELQLDDPAARERLSGLYLELGREKDARRVRQGAQPPPPPELLDGESIPAFEAQLEDPDPTVRLRAHRALVQALIDQEGKLGRAEAVAERGLQLFDGDEVLLRLLEESFRRRRQWDSVAAVLRRRLDAAEGAEARLAIHKAQAELLERQLGAEELALDVLRQAEREGPFDIDVSLAQERLLSARMRWSELERVLNLRLEAAADPRQRAGGRVALARIELERRFDPAKAWVLLENALVEAPDEVDALALAADAARRLGKTAEAVDVLERLGRQLEGPAAAEVFVQAGRWVVDLLGDPQRAETLFEDALLAHPNAAAACRALFELAGARRDWSAALPWAVRTSELLHPEGVEVLAEAARIADLELGDRPKALELMRALLEADSERPDVWARCGVLVRDQDPVHAAHCFETAAQKSPEPEQAARWFEDAGMILVASGDPSSALQAFRQALGRDVTRKDALLEAARMLETLQDWDEVYELGATFLLHHEAHATRAELAATFRRMARAKAATGDWVGAARFGRREIEIEASDDALERLTVACIHSGEPSEAAQLCRRSSSRRTGVEAVELLSKAGLLFGERAGDPQRAAVVLEEAQRLAPERGDLAYRVAVYRHQTHEVWAAARAYELLAEHSTGAARAGALRLAAGWLWEHNRGQARRLLERAAATVPTPDVSRDLGTLLEYDGDIDEVARPWLNLAEACRARGHLGMARQAFGKAAELAAFRSNDHDTFARAFAGLELMDPHPRWWVLRAHWADVLAEDDPAELEHAITAWLGVTERVPGHRRAVERLQALFERAGAELPARLLGSLLHPEQIEPRPDFDAPGPHPLPPLPSGPAEWLDGLGRALLSSQRDALRQEMPKRRDRIGDASVPIASLRMLQRAFSRLGRNVPEMYLLESGGRPMEPVYVEGTIGLGVDPEALGAVQDEDLLVGAALAATQVEPGSAALELLDARAVAEALGYIDQPRRRKALERGLDDGERERLDQLRDLGGISIGALRDGYRFRGLHAALVVTGSWHEALEGFRRWSGRTPGCEARRSLATFATRSSLLRWLAEARPSDQMQRPSSQTRPNAAQLSQSTIEPSQ